MNEKNFINLLPGFSMGITRALISHPFEILKIQTQLGIKRTFNFSLYKGVSYSVAANGLERAIQFYFFEKFKNNNTRFESSFKSSLISTAISFPYSVLLLKRIVSNNSTNFNKNIFIKSCSIEYTRNLIGSTIFLYTYDYLKHNTNLFFIPPIGATSSVWLLTYPLDSLKNKIINDGKIPKLNLNLYKGIQYPLLRSLPSSVIGMYVYEKVKEYINESKYKNL